jgi:hypothetical protein
MITARCDESFLFLNSHDQVVFLLSLIEHARITDYYRFKRDNVPFWIACNEYFFVKIASQMSFCDRFCQVKKYIYRSFALIARKKSLIGYLK